MTKVEKIEAEIRQLSPDEFAELRDRILEKDWQDWDRQIEHDARSGKLDDLFVQAEADHRAGKSTKL